MLWECISYPSGFPGAQKRFQNVASPLWMVLALFWDHFWTFLDPLWEQQNRKPGKGDLETRCFEAISREAIRRGVLHVVFPS
jgi:hypothetical protein